MWEIKYEKFPNLLSNWWKHLIKITLPHTASVKKFQQEATLLCAHSARLYFHKGTSMYYVSTKGGREGVSQMLTIAYVGGGGV